jgi:hypothetical protein
MPIIPLSIVYRVEPSTLLAGPRPTGLVAVKALKSIATIYSNYSLVAGAHNVNPHELARHVIDKVVVGKISVGICLSRDFTN